MLGAQHTILVLSDEAALVYSTIAGRYRFVTDIDWQDPDFVPNLAEVLRDKCRGRPVKILYDMVEQYYRREVVPKVAVFDQRLVLERRLVAAFPNYVMRQALPLKAEPISKRVTNEKEKAALEGKPYLFSAIPDHDSLTLVIEAVRESMVYVSGLYLLPVESVPMVQKLSTALNEDRADPDRWIVLMTQHRGGGLRQVVVRNGELCLTRLTNVIDTNVEHGAWATQVGQEFTATMGYVSRFGYTAESTLEVIVIGHPDAVELLHPLIKANQFHGLSLEEAIRLLHLPVYTHDPSMTADALHVGWAGKQMRYILPVFNRELAFISRARRGAKVAALALVFAALGGIGYLGNESVNLYKKAEDIEFQNSNLKKAEKEFSELNAEMARSDINVKLVQGAIAVHKSLETNKLDLIDFMDRLKPTLSPEFTLDNIEFSIESGQQQSADPLSVEIIETQRWVSKLNVSFPDSSVMKPEEANRKVNDFRLRLVRVFSDYAVTIEQPVKDLTYSTTESVSAGKKGQADARQATRQKAVLMMRQKSKQGGAS